MDATRTRLLAVLGRALRGLMPLGLLLATHQALALTEMSDPDLGAVGGSGISLALSNFSIGFSPTGYLEAVGTGTPPSFNGVQDARGDLIWYNPTISKASAADSIGSMTARDNGAMANWGTQQDPWVLRVESPNSILYDGSTHPWSVLNYYAPSTACTGSGASLNCASANAFQYAFWGDIEVKNPSTGALTSRLQSQSIWDGLTLDGSKISVFQNTYDGSLGMAWHNVITTDPNHAFRFSVANTQTAGCPGSVSGSCADPATAAPAFDSKEGIYFWGLSINMPVGALQYQPIVFTNDPANPTNLIIQLVTLPNAAAAYQDFYGCGAVGSPQACTVDGNNNVLPTGGVTGASYLAHHGSLTSSDLQVVNPTTAATNPGVMTDFGSINVNGILMQHFSMKTL